MRGIFLDEDDAQAAAAQLRADGYEAAVERERLAGEDDEEGHPWAVLTDAPDIELELLVEHYDGWLDGEQDEPPAGWSPQSPIELPTQPRRIKRPLENNRDDR